MQHSKGYEAFSQEEISHSRDPESDGPDEKGPSCQMREVAIPVAQFHSPAAAEGEREADDCQKESGCRASNRQRKAGDDIDLMHCKIIQVEGQMIEEHENESYPPQQVNFPIARPGGERMI